MIIFRCYIRYSYQIRFYTITYTITYTVFTCTHTYTHLSKYAIACYTSRSVFSVDNITSMVYNYLRAGSRPGTYTFRLGVQNDVSLRTVLRTFTLQRCVSGVSLYSPISVTTWNTSTYWRVNFGSLGSDACYMLDLKDDAAGASAAGFCLLQLLWISSIGYQLFNVFRAWPSARVRRC